QHIGRVRREYPAPAVDVQAAPGERFGSSGRGHAGSVRGAQYARPAGHGSSRAELRSAAGRALLQEGGMLLLSAADAGSRRSPEDARGLRDRSEAAARHQHGHAFVHVLRSQWNPGWPGVTAMADPDVKSASPLQVAKAVFWSFFGVRRRAEHEKDLAQI